MNYPFALFVILSLPCQIHCMNRAFDSDLELPESHVQSASYDSNEFYELFITPDTECIYSENYEPVAQPSIKTEHTNTAHVYDHEETIHKTNIEPTICISRFDYDDEFVTLDIEHAYSIYDMHPLPHYFIEKNQDYEPTIEQLKIEKQIKHDHVAHCTMQHYKPNCTENTYFLFTCGWGTCKETFGTKQLLQKHVFDGHYIESNQTDDMYLCLWEGCPKSFGRKASLKTHLLTHIQALEPRES